MAAGPVFPGFIRVEYQTDGSSKSKFLAEAAQLSGEVKKPFAEAFDQVGKMVDRVSGKLKNGQFSLDVDVSSLRVASAQADYAMKKVQTLRDAAIQLATSSRDSSASTQAFVTALQAQAAQAEKNAQVARDQVAAYSNLQGAVSGLTQGNSALADSYRVLMAEQSRAAAASNTAKYQAEALKVQEQQRNELLRLRAAADQLRSSLDPTVAVQQRYNAELEKVGQLLKARVIDQELYTKAVEKAARARANELDVIRAANAVPEYPRPANALPQNTNFGLQGVLADKRPLDAAIAATVTLEGVLGRVANKSREVGAAIAEADRMAAGAARERAVAEAEKLAASEKAQAAATAELQRMAQAAESLNARLNPAVGIQQRYNNEIEQARKLLSAGVIDQRLYGQAVEQANRDQAASLQLLAAAQDQATSAANRGTDATSNVINSTRSLRVAGIQAGQQIQDMAIQFQMGTNASTVLAQQLPQLAFALSGLEGNTNKTLSRVGAFSTFLAGPWGAAILIAGVALAPLIEKILGTGDAADEAKGKTYDFANGLNVLTLSANNAADAMAQLSNEMRNAIAVQGDFLAGKANVAQQSVQQLQSLYDAEDKELKALQKRATAINPFNRLSAAETYRMGALIQNRKPLGDALNSARAADTAAREALFQQRGLEAADPRTAATGRYNRAVGDLRTRFQQSQRDPVGAAASGRYINEAQYQAEFARLTMAKDKEIDALKKTKERKGADPAKAAERAAKAAIRLGEFGEDADKKIANIRDSFADIPPEVERVNKASRELDDIISDLMNRKPQGFESLKADAEALKASLADGVVTQALDGLEQSSQRQLQVQELLLSGRDAEATALQNIWQIEQRLGSEEELRSKAQALTLAGRTEEAAILTRIANQYPRIRSDVTAIAVAEQKRIEAHQKIQELQAVFLDSTRNVRNEVEAILGGYGKLSDLGSTLRQSFKQIQGKILTEKIFGDMFRDMDKWVKEKTGSNSAAMKMEKETLRAGDAAKVMADELLNAASRISGFGGGTASSGIVAGASTASAWGNMRIPDSLRLPGYDLDPNGPLNVTAQIKKDGDRDLTDLTPEEYFRRMGQEVGQKWASFLEPLLGKKLAGNLGGVLGGVLEGQATTGTGFGAILGGLKELKGLPKGISEGLGKAFGGAQTGAQIAGIGNALGIKMSNTGAQVGGAVGSFIPIPGGEIIGSIAGGLIGNLFKTVKSGYAQVRSGSVAGTYGRTGSLQNDAAEAAGGLVDTIASLAKTLGTKLGNYDFDFGKKNDKYVVNTGARGVSTFANEQDAMEFAVREAVADGAFIGLKEGAKRLLQKSGDLEAQVQKAVSFQNVFKELKAIKDPVGAAISDLNDQFSSLIDIFKEAGASAAEYAGLEELYGIKRKEAIDQANQAIVASLKGLLDELNIGSDYYSLRDRKQSALDVYNPLKARVAAGDTTAFDAFSDAARNLISIEREISGSTSPFFSLLKEVTDLSNGALNGVQAKIDTATASDSPFSALATQNAATVSAIDNQTSALIAALGGRLDRLNDNMIAAIRANVASGNTSDVTSLLRANGYW